MKKKGYKVFFKGKKPNKKQYYLVTLLAWLYMALSVALIIWMYERSDTPAYLKFIVVVVLMIFTPSIEDLFQSYRSFIKKYYEKNDEE